MYAESARYLQFISSDFAEYAPVYLTRPIIIPYENAYKHSKKAHTPRCRRITKCKCPRGPAGELAFLQGFNVRIREHTIILHDPSLLSIIYVCLAGRNISPKDSVAPIHKLHLLETSDIFVKYDPQFITVNLDGKNTKRWGVLRFDKYSWWNFMSEFPLKYMHILHAYAMKLKPFDSWYSERLNWNLISDRIRRYDEICDISLPYNWTTLTWALPMDEILNNAGHWDEYVIEQRKSQLK